MDNGIKKYQYQELQDLNLIKMLIINKNVNNS